MAARTSLVRAIKIVQTNYRVVFGQDRPEVALERGPRCTAGRVEAELQVVERIGMF